MMTFGNPIQAVGSPVGLMSNHGQNCKNPAGAYSLEKLAV